MRRLVFLLLSPGVITILCHAGPYLPVSSQLNYADVSTRYANTAVTIAHAVLENTDQSMGTQPQAEDDFGTTPEETPITLPVLENDEGGRISGDDDDDDEGDDGDAALQIDPATLDLDPDIEGRQPSRMTDQGTYNAKDDGHVTFVPAVNFYGSTAIAYTLSNRSGEASNRAAIRMMVTNVNDAPVIAGVRGAPIEAQAGKPVSLTLDDFLFTDPDGQAPADFSLIVSPGDHYTVSGTTVTPDVGFMGTIAVPVQISDGFTASAVAAIQLNVTQDNVPPKIEGQNAVTTALNQPVTILFEHLIVTDPDNVYPTGFTIQLGVGDNYTVSGQTVTPNTNYSGMLSVPVTVNDGQSSSTPFLLSISVNPNTPPVVTGQTALSTLEETPLSVSFSNIQVTDPDNTYPNGFTFTVQPGASYSVDGAVIIPAVNFAGILQVPVIVNDGLNDSQPFDLTVTVQNVNDAPVITGQASIQTGENQMIVVDLTMLTVTDADNAYPEDFSLSVLAGSNYAVSGNQITPAPGFNGQLTVGVSVNDGVASSEFFNLAILVTPVNDAPVITGQRSVTMEEETAVTLSLQDLTVADADNTYPDGFTLLIQNGENYSFSGTTVTPSADFTGTLIVNVVVNDGIANSAPFPFAISVTPVNDAPVITGPATLATNEDVPLAIALTDLQVSDSDNTYPSGFTLLIFEGAHYTTSGNTVIPERDYVGPLSVQIQVSDGSLSSNIFPLAVQVLPVNDPPVITGQVPLQTGEDVPAAILPTHLTVMDVDNAYPTGFSLQVAPGLNYTVSGTTVTPATDFNGTLNVGVTVHDGTDYSAPFNFQIQVGDANDAPVIVGQAVLSTNEEQPVTLALSHLTVVDPDNVYPHGFSLIVSPGADYTLSGQTIMPALDFAGVLSVPVRVSDGINNSATFIFKLDVVQINDPPVFTAIPNQQVAENSPPGSVAIQGISKGPMEADQQITFVATSGNTSIVPDPAIQYDGGSTAALSYSVVPNASGIVTITVVAIDNGSNVPPNKNSYSASFQIEVLEINTAPTLDPINNITIREDAEQQNITLTGISAGSGEAQSLSVSVNTDKPDFFGLVDVVYTSPEASGLLRFNPKPNMYGTAQFSVTVADNGPANSPHVNRVTRTFVVVIEPVNDLPAFTSVPIRLAAANENYLYEVQAADPDGDRVTIAAVSIPAWTTLSANGNGIAALRGKPPAAAPGTFFEVVLSAKDGTSSVEQRFEIYVNVRPEISGLSLVMEEDTPTTFSDGFFPGGYTDANDNALAEIVITNLPASGQLSLLDVILKSGDTISAASLPNLLYTPREDFFGIDAFTWNASDGYHFSEGQASVELTVVSVNDPPEIIFQSDTLQYEVNGEPAFLAPLAEIIDPDDDTLMRATVSFSSPNYRPETDMLLFQNTANIRGNFDFQTGVLHFTGVATQEEYRTALRSVRYLNQNTLDPLLEPKQLLFTLYDGETEGVGMKKVVMLQYTFVEFEIPSGFTPNGDEANDTWVIDRPGGGLEEMGDAIISIYNRQGMLVHRVRGFDTPWDGTRNGELLPADTYFYTIDLQLRNKKTYKGIVTILR